VKKKIYLACPYSHKDKTVREQRVALANRIAGDLMERGHLVFSPLSHSHPISETMDNIDACDFGFWLEQDLTFLVDWADEIWVLALKGWDKSRGVETEVNTARLIGKKTMILFFDDEFSICTAEIRAERGV
jgi:hypothetical protein